MASTANLRDLLPGIPAPRQARVNPFLEILDLLSPAEGVAGDPWLEQRREAQTPPEWDWQTWLIMAGRGFGKTRTGAEWSRMQLMSGKCRLFAFVAPTAGDARDVMIEGPAGFLKVCEPYGWIPKYEPSKRKITCPNGAEIHVYSAEEPDRLRGPQHDGAWSDEIAAWKNGMKTWDMLQFGLRLGDAPQQIATTTPRPVPLVKMLVADQYDPFKNPGGGTVITGGSTYENAKNLAKTFLAKIVRKYEKTRLGDQELLGRLLLDIPGALWSAARIEEFRIIQRDDDMDPVLRDMDLYRVVVGVDPMTKDPNKEADLDAPSETGIVTCGMGPFDEGYVLEDASQPGTPHEWGTAAVRQYRKWRADHIVAEANNGGLMVAHTINTIDPTVPVVLVHASRGKITRAEPVSALYEQGRVHHVGHFPVLEDQMTTFSGVPGESSPDRMDALVWGLTDLMIGLGSGEITQDTADAFAHLPDVAWG